MPDGVLRAEVGADEVLLNPATGVYHLLNPTARDLVDRLHNGSTVDEAIGALASDRDEEVATVRTDSQTFIRDMVNRGLLEELS